MGIKSAMKIQLLVLLCVYTAALAGKLESFKDFEDEFGELWNDPAEAKAASDELNAEESSIEQHNKDYEAGKSTYSEKLNGLSALTKDEMENEKMGLLSNTENRATGLLETPEEDRILSEEDQAYLDSIYDEMDRAWLPSSYDARTKGLITTPKNQMSCGSCAAFAATAVHETCMARAGTPTNGLDLSEQQMVDCGYSSSGANGCNGATIGAYQQYLASAGGTVSHEAQYPYLDRDPNLYCANKPKWNTGAKVSRAVIDYRCDEDKLKQLVYKYGAVATGIYASDPGFSNTYKGVFSGCSTKSINHAVTVVGWGTQNGTPYWIVKNSWGSSWGDGGYIKIRRGSSECGIGGNCAATECTYTGGYTPAPVAPPPPPIPPNQICDISSLYGRSDITGNYTLTTRIDGKEYVADVKCTNSKCSPRVAGPSNACMYICGKVQC